MKETYLPKSAASRASRDDSDDDEDEDEEGMDTGIQEVQDTLKLIRDAKRERKAPPKFKATDRWEAITGAGLEESSFETHKQLVEQVRLRQGIRLHAATDSCKLHACSMIGRSRRKKSWK